MSKIIVLVVAVACFHLAKAGAPGEFIFADGTLPAECPRQFKYITNIDEKRVAGDWYADFTPAANTEHCDDDCWETEIPKPIGGNIFSIDMCCKQNGKPFCGPPVGSFNLTHDFERPGEIFYQRGIARFPGFFMDVDYDNYLIAVVCSTNVDGSHTPMLFGYTRNRIPPPDFDARFFEVLKQNNIDPKYAHHVSQSKSCHYKFNSEGHH